ncbi:hypothetical protein BU24DRAFT_460713 [Aaosphaeria arxii CBS 175.79]|uniref:HMG box domain-containing protein n=1 Tax=Aaosphaeria arxii CBS 175.79 TaxID=1450172 RepID=A0A6A5XYB8_9PLEO|nr:uncharacterized protein BU24DRAFT_460713 [Aaosphaeria arxii CBS 175.79]KAF2017701.1 hypothetical protein BU24DRAFT_460713 [Aaosphaeria arxii CBS 175.79]
MAKKTQNHDRAEVLVSIEQFNRTRDSVIHALTTLQQNLTHVQEGLSILLRAYMNHSASLLAREDGATIESLQLPASLIANANAAAEAAQNASSHAAQAVASTPAAGASATEASKKKRKREKKERDPNAPKRPLTAAFLFAQSARPIVKADLERELEAGAKLEPNAVNLEVTKRWNEMDEEDKEKWKQSYRDSMVQFNIDMEAYKAKTGVAVEDLEEDEVEVGALETELSESEDEAGAAAKEATPPAPANKTPRPNKRQKTAAASSALNGANHVAIAPAAARSPVPLPAGGKQTGTPILPPAAETATPAKKDRKKKEKAADKAAPQAIAPAPAAAAEPAAEESKKKGKSRSTRNAAEPEATTETPAADPKPAPKKRDRSKRKSEVAAA